MSTVPSRSYGEMALADALAAWSAALQGSVQWWTGALARRETPLGLALDLTRWFGELGGRHAPTWATPHEIVFEEPLARLRDFSTATRDAHVAPTLVLPPQAGHDSCIVDYSPSQSQMRTILDAGLTRAYALDWRPAGPETLNAGVEAYLELIDRALDRLGGPANLIGDCQGGWLAAIYAALHPERVNTLTLAGAPIDFHAGDAVIHALLNVLAPGGDLSFYQGLVAAGGGALPGQDMLAGFILIRPQSEVSRQLQLLAHINEPTYVARYREFEDWFKHTQPIPGAFYLWIVEHLFRDNALIAGKLEIAGRIVELSRIACPLNLLGGETDHITPPAQVFALADHAGTPREDILFDTVPGGHLGLFMGRESLARHWPRTLAAVLERSLR